LEITWECENKFQIGKKSVDRSCCIGFFYKSKRFYRKLLDSDSNWIEGIITDQGAAYYLRDNEFHTAFMKNFRNSESMVKGFVLTLIERFKNN